MKIYSSKLLDIDAEIDNKYILLKDNGPLSILTMPILKKINDVFKDEKAISCDTNKLIFSSWIPSFPSIAFNRMIYSHIENIIFKRRIPDQLSIAITSKCPNKCIHCGASDIILNNINDLETSIIKNAVKQSLELGTYLITIDGGEPLMRQDICQIIKNVQSERSITSMFTSGFKLTEKKAVELKNSGLYSMKISLDSTIQKKHDKIRGRVGSYNDVIDSIKFTKKAEILTDLYITLSPYNIDELESFYEFATEFKIDEMSITGIIAIGRWKEHEEETISKKDIFRIKNFHVLKNKDKNGPRVSAMPYLLGNTMFGCFAGQRWMHITNGGDVLPCPYTPISFGNIKNLKLENIWKHMTTDEIYKKKYYECRMRNSEFRKKYIDIEKLIYK